MIKQFLSGYFSFTKKERRGIITLLILILFFLVMPFFFPLFVKPTQYDHSQFEKEIAQLKDSSSSSNDSDENSYSDYDKPIQKQDYSFPKNELFYFDPNTLDKDGWKKLGIRDKTITTIKNYISKGGKFYEPADIGKIWGMRKEDAERLIPYVQIKNSEPAFKKDEPKTNFVYEKKRSNYYAPPIDINTADTSAFIALPGIGNKLANRIISFRNKLGGFYKVEQVKETFGLPDSTYEKIKQRLMLTNPSVKQININTADIDELKAHPYIRYYVGNAIIQYRNQHGNYSSVDEIKKVALMTDSIFQKVAPYLRIN